MTKEEFEKLHNLHVKCWNKLAKNPKLEKESTDLIRYRAYCIACEIAHNTAVQLELEVDAFYCRYCPVALWRAQDIHVVAPPCNLVGNSKGAFFYWDNSIKYRTKSKYAKMIAEYEWEWMPEYEGIEVEYK